MMQKTMNGFLAAVLALVLYAPLDAQAMVISLEGQGFFAETDALVPPPFDENPARDFFAVANTSDPGILISQIIIDLGGSAGGVFFDLSVLPIPDGGAVATGFNLTSSSITSTLLTLVFNDFNPGEFFLFFIDVDNTIPVAPDFGPSFVTGAEFAGSTLTATFTGAIPDTTLTAEFSALLVTPLLPDALAVVQGRVRVPEPNTLALFAAGLFVLGFLGWRNTKRNGNLEHIASLRSR